METAGDRADKLAIPLYLGKDASGAAADRRPDAHAAPAHRRHDRLGQERLRDSIIMSVLLTRKPAEVQMILVDPKVVEMAMFKDVPHLMCPIVTEVPKAEAILEWASTKMDERYALLAEAGVKDIRSYNRLGYEG
jgi:S-DNA-T family DNA segregation ATPase FtsK/SpoIIIE